MFLPSAPKGAAAKFNCRFAAPTLNYPIEGMAPTQRFPLVHAGAT
jgi:hypothetical protein